MKKKLSLSIEFIKTYSILFYASQQGLTKKPINYFEYCADIRTRKRLSVKKVILNEPATIVFWGDGSKTVVKCAKGDKFNRYNGFCAALAKRIYGTSRARKIVEEGENQLVKDICKKGRKGKCRNK